MSAPVAKRAASWPLVLGALGIVFGDIGTSPLYTIRECLHHSAGIDLRLAVLGSLSLIFSSLVLVVGIKYVLFVLRIDNRGEGGIFTLMALFKQKHPSPRRSTAFVLLILAGAALLYGDGMITPAISVLAAAEGLEGFGAGFHAWVVPIAVVIVAGLFWAQHKGTGKIGSWFGPVMLVWFATLGVLGAFHIARAPEVLEALNPWHGFAYLAHAPRHAAGILGAVVLAITGAEALYADLGHFGKKAITLGWFCVAFPGLLLNYFGQGALLLADPSAAENPFFALVPLGWGRWLLIGLSILATIIASQAMISGTFSISRQAMQLGYFPRLRIVHTSDEQEGQIYIPSLNWFLAFGCLAIIFLFRSSNALAAAYGVAVTGTFLVTTIAYYRVAEQRYRWKKSLAAICFVFFAVDLVFFGSNLTKLGHGGLFPLVLGLLFLAVMYTWWRGRQEVVQQIQKQTVEADVIIGELKNNRIHRVSGAAVFMAASPTGTPIVLLHHLKANQCLHETVILLSLLSESVPRVKKGDRYTAEDLGEGVYRVVAHYGYLEFPQVPALLEWVKEEEGLKLNLRRTTYYFNRESILTDGNTGLFRWQKHLFRLLSETAQSARDFFGIPPNQIIEIGLPRQL